MFVVSVMIVDIIASWKWGDWRNWKKYQSSILYLITCDLLYNFLTYNHSLWEYEPTFLLPNHTIISIFAMFIAYPAIMLIYLGRYPSTFGKSVLWIGLWTVLWSFFEWLGSILGEFSYHNGWKLVWSVLFNIVLFSMVRLHYKKPLLTYVLSVLATLALLHMFDIPISKMK